MANYTYLTKKLNNLDPVEIYKLKLEGKIERFPHGFIQNKDNCVKIIKYLIEERLKLSDEEICSKVNRHTFEDNELNGMLTATFNKSSYEAINTAYPGKFKPWQLHCPKHYWNIDTAKEAIKWMIEEKLQWSDEEIRSKLCIKTFRENGMSSPFSLIFNTSPYQAINAIYPGKFKPWEIHCPNNYWNIDTAKEATKWMIEEKLQWSDEEICSNLSNYTFKQYNLYGMLRLVFNYSPYEAINAIYPGRFKPWQIHCPNNYWNIETAKDAIKWMIEEKLKWSDDDICSKLCAKTFKDNDLLTPLNNFFDNSPFKAINATYPGKFIKSGKHIIIVQKF